MKLTLEHHGWNILLSPWFALQCVPSFSVVCQSFCGRSTCKFAVERPSALRSILSKTVLVSLFLNELGNWKGLVHEWQIVDAGAFRWRGSKQQVVCKKFTVSECCRIFVCLFVCLLMMMIITMVKQTWSCHVKQTSLIKKLNSPHRPSCSIGVYVWICAFCVQVWWRSVGGDGSQLCLPHCTAAGGHGCPHPPGTGLLCQGLYHSYSPVHCAWQQKSAGFYFNGSSLSKFALR